jgi:hypothetical protein
VNRVLKAVVFLVAAIYFLVDAIFLSFAKSVANWISEDWIFENLRVWIVSPTALSDASIVYFASDYP